MVLLRVGPGPALKRGVTPLPGTKPLVQTASRAPKTVALLGTQMVGGLEQPPHTPVEPITVPALAVDGSRGGPERDSREPPAGN